MKKLLTVVFFILSAIQFSVAQNYVRQNGIPVTAYGQSLKFPWVGGLNAPTFNEIDLNGDGILDLFLFEKEGPGDYTGTFRMSTFINVGTPNQTAYVYAPQYESKFPSTLHDWAICVDYDCDGKKDIFAYAALGGIEVWHNDYNAITGLKFHLAYPLLYSYYGNFPSNIFVSRVNQAAFADIDGDGDLDVLDQTIGGGEIEYHRNKAMELYGRCDTLVMHLDVPNWGNASLSGSGNFFLGVGYLYPNLPSNCPNPQNTFRVINDNSSQHLHSGTCMTVFDRDGDGDMDLLNGDILATNLLYAQNCGTADTACICSQDTSYPSYNIPATLGTPMPGPYYMDVDNDGKKDLIVTSCNTALQGNQNYSNVLFYKNDSTNQNNVFHYVENRFIVKDMIDVGSNSFPVLFDVDGDGKKDLIVGNLGYFNLSTGGYKSGLTYFHNTGTPQCPAFTLDTTDYDGLSSLGYNGVAPTFGDLDNDGDMDMIFGEENGTLVYCRNLSGGAQAHWALTTPNLGGIDVGYASVPQLVDVDKDGLLDLLVGEAFGNINYYHNTGTLTNPVFTFVTSNFGGVNVVYAGLSNYGFSTPYLYDDGNGSELLVGTERGTIFHYNNIDLNLSGTFTLLDSMSYGIHEAARLTIARGDINSDGIPELVLGNYAGGLTMYSQNICNPLAVNSPELPIKFSIYPNPANDYVVIKFDSDKREKREVEIYDMLGQKIYSSTCTISQLTVNTKNLSNGMYVCKITGSDQSVNRKFVIKK